jgi:hypothetical protein
MKWMLGALLVLLALPAPAAAQGAPARAPGALPIEIKRGEVPPESKLGRITVQPPAQSDAAVSEAEGAAAALEQAQRDRQLIRDQTRQLPRRPDLGADVSGGIQQRNLPRSLGR